MANDSPSLTKNRNYLLLISAQTFSMLGREIGVIALPLLILGLTDSAAQAGLVAAISALPYLIFGLPAGALVDRWDRKMVMVFSELLRFCCVLSIPAAYYFGVLTIPQFYIVSFLMGTGFVFFGLAEAAALPSVVNRQQLARATSTYTVVGYGGELGGPTLSGFIISLAKTNVLGCILAYLVQAFFLFVSLATAMAIDKSFVTEKSATQKPQLRQEIQQGLVFLWQHPQLRTIALIAAGTNFLFGPVTLAIIVHMQLGFDASAAEIGILFSCAAASGLLASLVAPNFKQYLKVGPTMIACIGLWAIALTSLSLSTSATTLTMSWMLATTVGGGAQALTELINNQ